MEKINAKYIKKCITSASIFGFLICWDYISIVNKDLMSVLFSLPLWFGGGYIISRRFRNKKEEK